MRRVLAQQGGELRAAGLVVDRVELLERPPDQPPVAAARAEVGAHPAAQVGGLADVEGVALAVAHDVDARAGGGRSSASASLYEWRAPAEAAEGDRPLEGVDAALGEHAR